MKARSGQSADLGRFAFEFLHVVLAELAQAQVVGFPNGGRRKDLGDRQEQDFRRIAPRAVGRPRDALPAQPPVSPQARPSPFSRSSIPRVAAY